MTRILTIAAAAIALATAGSPALAQSTDGASIHVSYADLDLGTHAGQAVLTHRLDNAVKTVCGDRPMELSRQAAYQGCIRTARTGIDGQLTSIDGSTAVAFASGR